MRRYPHSLNSEDFGVPAHFCLTGNLTDVLEKMEENFCLIGKISLLKFDRRFDKNAPVPPTL